MFKSKLTISLCAVTAIFIFCAPALAQLDTLWTKTFGGSDYDEGYNVRQTSDGGFIVAGYTDSYGAGSGDVYLIKTDTLGNQQWFKTFGGYNRDEGYSVQQTSDGGFIIVGQTYSYGVGAGDVYLIKTDALGNQQWFKTFGGSGYDYGFSVLQTSDGGFIIAGITGGSYGGGEEDVYLIKTDALGNQQWYQTYGGSDYDYGFSVQQTSDGGFIIVGKTYSYGAGEYDVYLIKTDALGNQQWYRTFGGSDDERGYSVQQTSDGGFIIAGGTNSFGGGSYDVYLIKTDALGDQQWYQTFGGSDSDEGRSVQQTSDGGFIIAGITLSFGAGNADVYLIKTDASGNQQWYQTFGGTSGFDGGYSIQQTSDGGFVIAGYTGSYGAGDRDVYLIRLEAEGSLVEDFGNTPPSAFTLFPPSPNPFNSSTAISFTLPSAGEISLKIYDISGREVQSLIDGHWSIGTHSIVWNAEGQASGIYFVRMQAGEYVKTQKLVLMK